jgi:predicted DNA-binding transcriptional regulator YafY
MAEYRKYRRLLRIIHSIVSIDFPTKAFILHHLNEFGYPSSARTLERDFLELRSVFGININYSAVNKGYDLEPDVDLSNISQLALDEISLELNNQTEFIQFEQSQNSNNNISWIAIVEAIEMKRMVEIKYYSWVQNKAKKTTIKPYFLKEDKSNWMIAGISAKKNNVKNFSIPQILSVNILNDTYNFNEEEFTLCKSSLINEEELYTNPLVSISFSTNQLEKLEHMIAKYSIKKSSVNSDGQLIVEFENISNNDVKSIIYQSPFSAKIIAPKDLRNLLKRELKEILKNQK